MSLLDTLKKRNDLIRFISLLDDSSLEGIENHLIKENYEVDPETPPIIESTLLEAITADSHGILTEDVQKKIAIIFDAAINEKVAEKLTTELKKLNESIESKSVEYEEYTKTQLDHLKEELEAEYSTKLETLEEKLDSYLDYVANEWCEDNKIAIEAGVKAQISESVLSGLKKLFEENSIEISDEQVNLVSELESKNKKLYESNVALNDQVRDLTKKTSELNKKLVLESVGSDLSDLEKDRLITLAKNIKAPTVEEFRKQIEILKESLIQRPIESRENVTDTQLNEGKALPEFHVIDDPKIKSYLEAISKMGFRK